MGDKNMSLNQTTINNLIDAFGDETENWIGKEVYTTIVRVMIGGELKTAAYLAAEGWKMDSNGKFYNVNQNHTDVQTTGNQQKFQPVIQVDDIDFEDIRPTSPHTYKVG